MAKRVFQGSKNILQNMVLTTEHEALQGTLKVFLNDAPPIQSKATNEFQISSIFCLR